MPAVWHCVPHAPQFCGSVLVLVQTPLHLVFPVGQLHAPLTHFSPPEQAWPQAPQLVGSTCVLTQALARYREQGVWGHDPVLPEEGFGRLRRALLGSGFLSREVPFTNCVDNRLAEEAVAKG